MGVRIHAAALLLCGLALGARAIAFADSAGVSPASQQTTRDKVYAKEQAARGAEIYVKHCDRCHDPTKVLPGKKPGPQTIGPKFLETWQDRTLGELFGTILNTMPSDGSITLAPDPALDLVAHLLQANGFPAGQAPLKNDEAMKAIVIVK